MVSEETDSSISFSCKTVFSILFNGSVSSEFIIINPTTPTAETPTAIAATFKNEAEPTLAEEAAECPSASETPDQTDSLGMTS